MKHNDNYYFLSKEKNNPGNWVTMVVIQCDPNKTYKVEGKVFDEGSKYGVFTPIESDTPTKFQGKVSKLWIVEFDIITKERTVVFNYDRGHDFQNCPDELVEYCVTELEKGETDE